MSSLDLDRARGTLEEIVRLYKWSEPFEDNQFWIRFVQGGEHYFYTPFYHDLRIEYEDGSYERGDSNTQRFRDWWNVSGAYANEDDDRGQDEEYGEEEEYSDSVHRDADRRRSGDDFQRWEEKEYPAYEEIPYDQPYDHWEYEDRREHLPERRRPSEGQSNRYEREERRQNRYNQRRSNTREKPRSQERKRYSRR